MQSSLHFLQLCYLGLRTLSYVSLQNQLQNNNIGVALHTQTTTSAGAVLVRNKSKMLLSIGKEREKEKFLPKIGKFVGRRRVGMLLIFVVSVVVLMSVLISICKVVNITHDYSKSDMEISTGYGLFSDEDVPAENISTLPNNMSGLKERILQPLAPIIPKSVHQCVKFTLPPPPAAKEWIGPRPCPRSKPGHQTRFNIDDADLFEVEYCDGIVAASAIFETEAYMKNSSSLNEKKKVGIWRVVIVRNLPYKDARRNGKVPKLLLHRIFPNARYSIWIDRKLELIVALIRFLGDSCSEIMQALRSPGTTDGYHRDLLEHRAHSLVVLRPPPPPSLNKPVENSLPLTNEPVGKSTQEATNKIAKPLPSNPGKRRRKSSSKCHRKTGGGIKDSNSI
ncbi:hypothetical protein GIB67_043278 [Kingdonia uniflora]|uniref:TOD1/MUCI70 glycosyltransferase-like domain-containing protein n=1 Tax=Kingdonia uniflora TaxID=39325 RepID=A0A7J7L0H7_9MAGN|nr:hypothetical protein GIB67_043278 [Kingdonia uniflora]